MTSQSLEGGRKLPWAGLRDRIVEREHEAGLRRSVQSALDDRPRLQVVGERQCAEIVAQWGADPGSDREHRGNARDNRQFQLTPGRGPLLDLLANRRRHGEHAGVAAGYQRNIGTRRRGFERGACPRAFLAIVGGMAALSGTRRRAIEIRSVTEQRVRGAQHGFGLRCQPTGISGTEPDHGQPASHDRSFQPGTSTIAK